MDGRLEAAVYVNQRYFQLRNAPAERMFLAEQPDVSSDGCQKIGVDLVPGRPRLCSLGDTSVRNLRIGLKSNTGSSVSLLSRSIR